MIFTFEGKTPNIDPLAFISPTASIIGDVEIGEKTNVWFGAVIMGDFFPIRIGKCNSIQDNVVIHADTIIGSYCRIAHGSVVHGCILEDNILVGSNATIFDGCKIGEGAIIGIGAVVPPNTYVPPRTVMLGVPVKAVRKVSDEEVENMIRRAMKYVELAKRYLSSGFKNI